MWKACEKDDSGVRVTCPDLITRVKPIYLTTQERKAKNARIHENQKAQLRSIIGSLAWLARVCRPDLAYTTSRLQARVHEATYEDVKLANTLVAVAQKTKDEGLFFPSNAFKFEDAIIVGIQDASFANDQVVNEKDKKPAYRSQSGRLACLAPPDFETEDRGVMMVLDWRSTTVKRVCRSTLQAEAMILSTGVEECERVRAVMYGLHHVLPAGDRAWQTAAMDFKTVLLYTDCRTLEAYVN